MSSEMSSSLASAGAGGSATATASIAVQTKNAAGRLAAGGRDVVLGGGVAGLVAILAAVGL